MDAVLSNPATAGTSCSWIRSAPSRIPPFEEVEPDVRTAWLGERKAEAWEEAYKKMRAKYVLRASRAPGKPAGQGAVVSGGPPMSPVVVSLIVLASLLLGALAGMVLRARLPESHLSAESREMVKMGTGLVATMSALVLGLLVASAKSAYDAQRDELTQLASRLIMLDRMLAHYGPETMSIRVGLRQVVLHGIDQVWREGLGIGPGDATNEVLYDRLQALKPQSDAQRATLAQAAELMASIAQARWLMFTQRVSSISFPLLVTVVFWLTINFVGFRSARAPERDDRRHPLRLRALRVGGHPSDSGNGSAVHGDHPDSEPAAARSGRALGSVTRPRPAVRRRGTLPNLRALLLGTAAWLLFAIPSARAHEARPAYLEIRETGQGRYDLLWRTPVLSGMRLPVALKVPDGVRTVGEPIVQRLTDSLLERRTLDAGPAGLAGKRIEFPGLQGTITDVLVRVQSLDGRTSTTIVRAARPWSSWPPVRRGPSCSAPYVLHGIRHIAFGLDHLLFVFGLLLIVQDRWMLVKTITAFTVAHSLTLAIATFGWAEALVPPLNAAIALSIFFLGPEIVRSWRGQYELHDSPSLGRGVSLRSAARLRLLLGPDERRLAARRPALRASRIPTSAWRLGSSPSCC